MGVREKLRYYCPRPIKRTGRYIVRASVRIQKEMVPSNRMKWLAISLYVALLLFTWLDYFNKLTGYATLEGALLYTLLAPILTYAVFRVYRIAWAHASLKFWQTYWTALGAGVFGFVIYAAITFLLNRVLLLTALAEDPFVFIPYILLSYVIGGYLGYRVGKRRQFRPIIL